MNPTPAEPKPSLAERFTLLPCRLLGHRWVEVPRSFRGRKGEKMRFQCSRCNMMGGFTN